MLLLKKIAAVPISNLKFNKISSLEQTLTAIRLSCELEQQYQMSQLFQIKNKNLIYETIKFSNKQNFNNVELVKQIRIQQYQLQHKKNEIKKKLFLKSVICVWGILFILHIGIQSWNYLEYDLWLTSPELSDYHINRFR